MLLKSLYYSFLFELLLSDIVPVSWTYVNLHNVNYTGHFLITWIWAFMSIYIITCLHWWTSFLPLIYSHKPTDGQRALREAGMEVGKQAVSACEEVKLRWWVSPVHSHELRWWSGNCTSTHFTWDTLLWNIVSYCNY